MLQINIEFVKKKCFELLKHKHNVNHASVVASGSNNSAFEMLNAAMLSCCYCSVHGPNVES